MTPLERHIRAELDAAIVGKTLASDGDLFTTFDHTGGGSYVRNPTCWANRFDFSGMAVYCGDAGGYPPTQQVTLLDTPSRKIVIGAHHGNPPGIGDTVRFVSNANKIFGTTTAASISLVDGTGDFFLFRLTDAAPAWIKAYKTLSWTTATGYFSKKYLRGVPVVVTHHKRVMSIAELGGPLFDPPGQLFLAQSADYAAWFSEIVGNLDIELRDSSCPLFAIGFADGPVLLGTNWAGSMGDDLAAVDCLPAFRPEVNAGIAALEA